MPETNSHRSVPTEWYEHGPDMHYSIDAANETVTQCNGNLAHFLRRAPEQLVGLHHSVLYPAESHRALQAVLARLRSGAAVQAVPVRVGMDRTGAEARLFALPGVSPTDNRPIFHFAWRHADAPDGLAAVVDASPSALVIIDATGNLTLVNREAEVLFGYRREELIGLPVEILLPGHLREAHEAHRSRYLQQPERRPMGKGTYNLVGRRRDGSEFAVEIGLNPLPTPAGLVVLAAVVDVAERRRAEQALQDSERRIRLVADSLQQLVWSCLPDGRCDFFNQQWVNYTGIAAERQMGGHWLDRVHPADRGQVTEAWRDSVAKGKSLRSELRLLRHDGEYHWFDARAEPLRTASGKVERWFGSATDIGDRRALLQSVQRQANALARSNADLQQFAYAASHDLQEPLRMIATYLQLLDERIGKQLDADSRSFLDETLAGAMRLRTLIQDLATYTRLDAPESRRVATDLNRLVGDVLGNLRAAIAEANAAVSVGALPTLVVDPAQMVLLFQNLIGNAIKFRGPRSPRIAVHATRNGSRWVFQVRDNGIGIDPRYHHKIFAVFQRLHPRSRYPGNGIGLALCKSIVEKHGGIISVESREGDGTTFRFSLPHAPQQDDSSRWQTTPEGS